MSTAREGEISSKGTVVSLQSGRKGTFGIDPFDRTPSPPMIGPHSKGPAVRSKKANLARIKGDQTLCHGQDTFH
jgi:hypothetical protein